MRRPADRALRRIDPPESGQGLRRSARPEAPINAPSPNALLRRQPQRVDAASDRRAADRRPGDGSQIYTPPKTPAGQQQQATPSQEAATAAQQQQASASAMPPNSQAQSTLTYRQPAQANAAVGPVTGATPSRKSAESHRSAADSRASTSTVLPAARRASRRTVRCRSSRNGSTGVITPRGWSAGFG